MEIDTFEDTLSLVYASDALQQKIDSYCEKNKPWFITRIFGKKGPEASYMSLITSGTGFFSVGVEEKFFESMVDDLDVQGQVTNDVAELPSYRIDLIAIGGDKATYATTQATEHIFSLVKDYSMVSSIDLVSISSKGDKNSHKADVTLYFNSKTNSSELDTYRSVFASDEYLNNSEKGEFSVDPADNGMHEISMSFISH